MPELPLATAVTLHNARCFVRATIPLDPRVTVVIGENGAGKTTLAEILGSFAGAEEGLPTYPRRAGAAKGEARLMRGRKTIARFGSDGRASLPASDLLFAYGRYRRVEIDEGRVGAVSAAEGQTIGTLSLLDPVWVEEERRRGARDFGELSARPRTTSLTRADNGLFRDVRYKLAALWDRRSEPRIDAAWNVLRGALRRLGQRIDDVCVEERGGQPVPVVRRAGHTLALDELSDGYQAILVVLLDLLLRYLDASPREDFAAERGLVVIDEVDLHLHPRWQRLVVGQLTDTFPGTQFVLTTHSGAVVQGAIDRRFPIVRLEEAKGRAEVKVLEGRKEQRFKGASVSSLLFAEDLFGVGSLYGTRYETHEVEARALSEKIERGEASEKDEAKLLRILVELEDVVARDEELRGEGGVLATFARSQRAFAERLARMGDEKKKRGGRV